MVLWCGVICFVVSVGINVDNWFGLVGWMVVLVAVCLIWFWDWCCFYDISSGFCLRVVWSGLMWVFGRFGLLRVCLGLVVCLVVVGLD